MIAADSRQTPTLICWLAWFFFSSAVCCVCASAVDSSVSAANYYHRNERLAAPSIARLDLGVSQAFLQPNGARAAEEI